MKLKTYEWYKWGGKVPRKVKKKYLGIRKSRSLVQRMVKETIPQEPIKTMYERRDFLPYGAFCPKCGNSDYVGTGNQTTYPEHWEYFRCVRCRNVVGYIDNSPFIHALECMHSNYNPVF